jgi:hypothetical protein
LFVGIVGNRVKRSLRATSLRDGVYVFQRPFGGGGGQNIRSVIFASLKYKFL